MAPHTTMTAISFRPKWRALALLLLPFLAIAVWILARRHPPAPPPTVVVMPLPYKIPPQKVPLPDRWIPRSWGWLWRLKQRVLGPAKGIQIETTIFQLPASSEPLTPGLAVGQPVLQTNGLRVWLVAKSSLTALRRRLDDAVGIDSRFSPRIATADGTEAQLFMQTATSIGGVRNSVGTSVDLLPRVHKDSTDLTTIFRLTEAVTNQPDVTDPTWPNEVVSMRTNCEVAARIQIPKDSSVFLLETRSSRAGGKSYGIIISPEPPRNKKK